MGRGCHLDLDVFLLDITLCLSWVLLMLSFTLIVSEIALSLAVQAQHHQPCFVNIMSMENCPQVHYIWPGGKLSLYCQVGKLKKVLSLSRP